MLPSKPTTYVYLRDEDGVCCHRQVWMGTMGDEYEHPGEPNWMPPDDWPYEVKDLRKKESRS